MRRILAIVLGILCPLGLSVARGSEAERNGDPVLPPASEARAVVLGEETQPRNNWHAVIGLWNTP